MTLENREGAKLHNNQVLFGNKQDVWLQVYATCPLVINLPTTNTFLFQALNIELLYFPLSLQVGHHKYFKHLLWHPMGFFITRFPVTVR
jgi:hypothetical protein